MSNYKLDYTAIEVNDLLGKAKSSHDQLGGISLSVTDGGILNIKSDGTTSGDESGVDIITDSTAKNMLEAIKVIAAANLSISRHMPKLRQQISDLQQMVYDNKSSSDKADKQLSDAISQLSETVNELSSTVGDNKTAVDKSVKAINDSISSLTKTVTDNKKAADDVESKLNKSISALSDTVVANKKNTDTAIAEVEKKADANTTALGGVTFTIKDNGKISIKRRN